MENLLCNSLPVPIINIKDADDCIIEEINTTISNSDIVNDWDVKNSKKIKSKLSVCENEKVLEDVLKDYIRILREQALHFREKSLLKEKVLRHVKVFYMYYTLNDGIPMEINYSEYMEKILIFLCNLELEVIRRVKKKDKDYRKKIKEVAQNLIRIVNIFLLNKEQCILHVLLRLDSRRDSQSWKDTMHIVYRFYLITVPVKDRSEECFCRNFLLFQKWKSITEKTKHVGMDKIMYFRFNRTPETEVTNPTLRSILNSDKSIVDIIDVLSEDRRTDIDNYFKYIDEKDREEDVCLPQSINLDSEEEEEDSTQRLEFVHTERDKRNNGVIKTEKPAQENVHYVEVPANNGQVVCVIDDDSDVEEVGVQINNKNRRKLSHKYSPTQPAISFLDSILIPGDDANSSINNSSSTPTCSAEEVTLTSLVKNSSPSTLPLLTTYLNYMRSKGSVIGMHVQENEESSTVTNMESLSIADASSMEIQTEMEPPTSVESASEVLSEKENQDNVQSESDIGVNTHEVGVENEPISPVNNNQLPLNEEQQTKNSDDSIKCNCPCKCSSNRISENTQNVTNNKTAKIQTEGVQNFSFICGFITPPSSDRTSDETSPESMENICAEQQGNNLHDNNASTYTYVPNMAICDTDTRNSSPNQYESDGEIHNYSEVCDTSTQISTFNEPEPDNNQDQNNYPENLPENVTEHHIEIVDVNVNTPEPTSDEQESPESFNVTSPEVQQEPTELVTEIEVNEVMIPPIESYDEEQDNQGFEFEQSSNLSDGDAQETHEEYEILNVTEPVSTPKEHEPEKVPNETVNNETYTHLNGMQVIAAEPQSMDNPDGEANSFVIPMDVILDNYQIPEKYGEKSDYQPYTANAEIVLAQNASKDDAIFNKLSVFRKVEEEATVNVTSQNNQFNNNNHKINDNVPNFTVNKILSSPAPTKLNAKSDNCKIQASVSMPQLINKPQPVKKLNGDNIRHDKNKSVSLEEKQKQDKIMYTSNERVSAPLSVFAQFEQSQTDLVENAFSGPIEPINNKPSINSDNSNSNDSFYLFESNQFSPPKAQHKQNQLGSPEESSPISPPYEAIHAQEFQSHIFSLESLAPKPKTLAETVIHVNEKNETVNKRENRLNNINNFELPNKSPVDVVSKSTSKRKLVEETASPGIKKPRVNFGSTEVRIIPREELRLISDEVIEEARESMEEYKISANDRKLLYLQPQVPVKNDTPTELQEKEKQMRLQHAIIQSLLSAKKYNLEKTCIVKRVDYKKPLDETVLLNPSSTRSLENSISSNFMNPIGSAILNSTSKRMETASLSNFSPPSGYIPPLNSYEAVRNMRAPLIEEVQVSSGAGLPQNNIQNTLCHKLSNERFNDLLDQCNTEILNLSVNSKSNTPTTEINVPESEFSRSPEFLQNPDQIVQQCLIDNLENTEVDPDLNVNNNIAFLSNNSNFYTTGSQFKPPEESFSCPLYTADSKCSIDDDLLLKREIEKMIQEKIKNFESETCLPFKKRRVPTVTVKPSSKTHVKYQPDKEEISYPATPMISIAEIEALQQNERANNRSFKTPAERKEMPPLPVFYNLNAADPSPIITDQFNINNHTYNNPTINYHMSNVPMPFINVPCASYYSLPPILLPFNNLHTFDSANVNQNSNAYNNDDQVTSGRIVKKEKKEKRKRSKKEKHYSENYYPDYKKSDSKTV